jgi:CO dehydrogenase maturation factor
MKIAVIGKGGSGKTTTSAVLARSLARRGHPVVALDCDSNANLGISLGVGFDDTEQLVSMRERLDDGQADHAPAPTELLDRFGREAPDGVQLAVVTRIENIEPGCPCCGLSPDQLLGAFDAPDRMVIADLEAGIGTLTRVDPGAIDVAVLVAEPTQKSLDVAQRARELARQKAISTVVVVASKVATEADLDAVRDRFPGVQVIAVPDDPAIMRADRDGVAPMDHDPDSPAVVALGRLADMLAEPAPVA